MAARIETEALRTILREFEKTPRNDLVVEQESLRIRQIFKPVQGHAQYYSIGREVEQILVGEDELCFDICREAPAVTKFKTEGVLIGIFSNFDKGVPGAFCFRGEDGNPVVLYNPKILNLRGGVLAIFHEEGHAWQMVEGRFSTGLVTNKMILENFEPNEAKREEIDWVVAVIDQRENDAWDFAIEKYWNYRKRGLNVAPRISEEELDSYPQHWLDFLNKEHWQVANFLGRDKLFVRKMER